MPLKCPVCDSRLLEPSTEKFGVQYLSCKACNIIFAENLDPKIIQTHNNGPEARADMEAQNTRLQRCKRYLDHQPEKILDFGCGRGDYVKFLNDYGIPAWGVDQDTDLKISDFSLQSFDIINMVEVIEHLGNPFEILQQLINLLKPEGVLYIESSFVDFIGAPEQSAYIDPRIGHCCIHSQHSIDYLCKKLMTYPTWINNNVVILRKI